MSGKRRTTSYCTPSGAWGTSNPSHKAHAYVLDQKCVLTSKRSVARRRGVRWLLEGLQATLEGRPYPLKKGRPSTPNKYAYDISCLAISDENKQLLFEMDAVKYLTHALLWKHEDHSLVTESREFAMAAICQLSFHKLGREQIEVEDGLLDEIRSISLYQSPHTSDSKQPDSSECARLGRASKHAKRTLFNMTSRTPHPELADAEAPTEDGHVMLSYAWGPQDHDSGRFPNQDKVIWIKEMLEAQGHKIWLDVDAMAGSTLEAMALAVEGSSCVCIILNRDYKESAACR